MSSTCFALPRLHAGPMGMPNQAANVRAISAQQTVHAPPPAVTLCAHLFARWLEKRTGGANCCVTEPTACEACG